MMLRNHAPLSFSQNPHWLPQVILIMRPPPMTIGNPSTLQSAADPSLLTPSWTPLLYRTIRTLSPLFFQSRPHQLKQCAIQDNSAEKGCSLAIKALGEYMFSFYLHPLIKALIAKWVFPFPHYPIPPPLESPCGVNSLPVLLGIAPSAGPPCADCCHVDNWYCGKDKHIWVHLLMMSCHARISWLDEQSPLCVGA